MHTTLSIIKADVGSIGGHVSPSNRLIDTINRHVSSAKNGLFTDFFVGATGDDIAILMVHNRGTADEEVHRLAWDAFQAGTKVAQQQGLYGAGQDLLVDSFSGNVKGMGPAVAEMEFEERPNEPFLMFMADKTEPGAYNLPLYLAFADPMNTAGLLLSPEITKGFTFRIMDVNYTEGDRVIELSTPEDLYDLHNAAPQHRGKIHGQGRSRAVGARTEKLSRHGRSAGPLQHRPLCRRLHARQSCRAVDAGAPWDRLQLLRWSSHRQLLRILRT
jgi:fructose 1,6-bisphosphate aldolase/phosphatase